METFLYLQTFESTQVLLLSVDRCGWELWSPGEKWTILLRLHLWYWTLLIRWVIYSKCETERLGYVQSVSWWRHQMETFSALLALCAGNSPLPGEFPTQRPVTRSFDVYFDLHPNKRLGKQSWGWWFETLSWSLWRHRNGVQKFQVLWNEWLISSQTLLSMWLLIHVRIKVNPC